MRVLIDDFVQPWWRTSKKEVENLFNIADIRTRYIALQQKYRAGSVAGKEQFNKWFARVSKFVSYYARGGQGYKRDHDLPFLDFSHLRRDCKGIPIRSYEQLSDYAHKLN